MSLHRTSRAARGLARLDVLAALIAGTLLIALLIPGLAHARTDARGAESHSNLIQHAFANLLYTADYNGEQVSFINHTISEFGNDIDSALGAYEDAFGVEHPGAVLGWGPDHHGDPRFYQYATSFAPANAWLLLPFRTGEAQPVMYGSYRLSNFRGYREYLAAKFYDPVFYAPQDDIVMPLIEPGAVSFWEYSNHEVIDGSYGDLPYFSSYSFSPAAMFHPDVLANPTLGGWTDPWSIDHGFDSPTVDQTRHPSLKTLMIEQHWLQNAPEDRCNAAVWGGTYDGCEPYLFNHGLASSPNALFFDLSIRQLPNTEVVDADTALLRKTGYGLWSRDVPSFGKHGYNGAYAYDVRVSHHFLTTDGILGRDTLGR